MENLSKYLGLLRDNIRFSWKTTLLGSIVFLIGVVMFFYPQSTIDQPDLGWEWWQSLAVLMTGVVLVCFKDKDDDGNSSNGVATAMIALLMITLMTSCATSENCIRKWGSNETIIIKDSLIIDRIVERQDSIVEIPGDSIVVYTPSPCDTLGNLKPDFIQKNVSGRVRATVRTVNNQLVVDCECLSYKKKIQGLNKTIKEQLTRINNTDKTITLEPKLVKIYPWYSKWWVFASIYLIGHLKLIQKAIKLAL